MSLKLNAWIEVDVMPLGMNALHEIYKYAFRDVSTLHIADLAINALGDGQ